MDGVKHDPPDELEYNQITDHIYIGTNMCCQTHFDGDLLNEGIEVNFSLEAERLDAPYGVDFFVWLPVVDHTAPSQDQLKFGSESLQRFVAMGKKIYVHCQNGHGRAPTMVAAYLITEGKTVEEAIAYIKEKRPVIHLDDVQVEALTIFEKSL